MNVIDISKHQSTFAASAAKPTGTDVKEATQYGN